MMAKRINFTDTNTKFDTAENTELTYTGALPLDFMFKGEVITLNVGDILNFETGEIERANDKSQE